jgi:hypothetical protein
LAKIWPTVVVFPDHFSKNPSNQVPPAGIELLPETPEKAALADLPGTESGTLPANEAAELVRVLASLTPEERASLLALVRQAN